MQTRPYTLENVHRPVSGKFLFILLLALFLGFLCRGQTAGPAIQPVLRVAAEDDAFREGLYRFGDRMFIFADDAAQRSIDMVRADSFQHQFYPDSLDLLQTFGADLGHEIQAVWGRLRITCELPQKMDWRINLSAGEVEMFVFRQDSLLAHRRSGTVVPLPERPFLGRYGILPALPLSLSPGDTFTVFFRIQGVAYPLGNRLLNAFNLTLFQPETLFAWDRKNRFLNAAIVGILLAVAIYHLIIFLYQRQVVSLFFSVFVFAHTLTILFFNGYLYELVLPGRPFQHGLAVASILWSVVYLFHYLFSRRFLRLPERLPGMDKTWMIFIGLFLAGTPLAIGLDFSTNRFWEMDPEWALPIFTIRALLTTGIVLFSLATAFLAWRKSIPSAPVYLIAMAAFVVQVAINELHFGGMLIFPSWVPGDAGHVLMVLLLATGIARQLRTLQEEKVAAEQARLRERAEAERMRELDAFKSRFFTHITHQFRTPLTIILGMARQIRQQPATWVDKGTAMIRSSGQRLLRLVNQILDLSRLEAGQLPVAMIRSDLVNYVGYIIGSFRSAAEQKGILLDYNPKVASLEVDHDPDKLMDIVSNLLENAIKFTGKGGRVNVSLESVRIEGRENVRLSVVDNGPGIRPEALPHIFDRFFQEDQTRSSGEDGAGIGLALTQELVHLLDGKIAVQSKVGEGTTFFVTLPITRSAPIKAPVTAGRAETTVSTITRQEEDPPGQGKPSAGSTMHTLLIVEDNHDLINYLKAILDGRFHMLVAYNGEEGLAKAQKHLPDLVISDVMMPLMDGLEFCQRLKAGKSTSHIPVILLTARVDAASRIEGLRTGADAYVAKPFDPEELLVRINQLIAGRARLQLRYRDLAFIMDAPSDRMADEADPEDAFLHELRLLIEEKLADPDFQVDDLCRELGMSRATLYKKFKDLTNRPLGGFIRQVRLHKARHLLQTTGLNVSEVGARVGFKTLSTFSRRFKKEFGYNPSEIKPSDKPTNQ